jgi:hypothetical protein
MSPFSLGLRNKTKNHREEHQLAHRKLEEIYHAIRIHDSEHLDRLFLHTVNIKVLPLELNEDGTLPTMSDEKCFFRPMTMETCDRYPINTKDPSTAKQLLIREAVWKGQDLKHLNNNQPLFLSDFIAWLFQQAERSNIPAHQPVLRAVTDWKPWSVLVLRQAQEMLGY